MGLIILCADLANGSYLFLQSFSFSGWMQINEETSKEVFMKKSKIVKNNPSSKYMHGARVTEECKPILKELVDAYLEGFNKDYGWLYALNTIHK